jgi:N6-adenosine-specific RNA methylase IME4
MTWPFGELKRGHYAAICADPPWSFRSNSKAKPGRNAMRHYDCMTMEEIAALPVSELAAPDAALFLWITGPFLAIGAHIPIMKAWGFKPTAMAFTWVKLKVGAADLFFLGQDLHFGQGFTTRKNAEFVILGKRGRSVRRHAGVHEIILAPIREHSRKPPEFLKRVRCYVGHDAPICELFARERVPGVDAWGNQTDKFSAGVET